jgi:hypothetical protein
MEMINSTQHAEEALGSQITFVQAEDGTVYVPLKRLCESLRIDYEGQRSKVRNSKILNAELVSVPGTDGRHRKMLCLPIDAVGDWASTIDPSTLKPQVVEVLTELLEEPDESLRADESKTERDTEKERIEGVYDSLHDMACFLNKFSTWIDEMMKCRYYFPGQHLGKASRAEVRKFVRRTRSNLRVMQATVDAARNYEKSDDGLKEQGLIELHNESSALFSSIVDLIGEVCDEGYGLASIDHPALKYLAGAGFGAMSHSGLEMIRDFHETIIPPAKG